jgi:hypothetical protein
MIRHVCIVSFAAFLLSAFGVSGGMGAEPKKYSLTPSARCLNHAGGKVSAIRRTDRRRTAVSDLAQRGSREVRFGPRSVLLAFTRGTSEAEFLHEALVVPNDPYMIRVKSNVVLMYRPDDVAAFRRVLGCLRVA